MIQALSYLCQMSTLNYNILTTVSQWRDWFTVTCNKIFIMFGVLAFLSGLILRYLTGEISLAVHRFCMCGFKRGAWVQVSPHLGELLIFN